MKRIEGRKKVSLTFSIKIVADYRVVSCKYTRKLKWTIIVGFTAISAIILYIVMCRHLLMKKEKFFDSKLDSFGKRIEFENLFLPEASSNEYCFQ